MQLFPRTITIGSLLTQAYLVIWIPTFFSSWNTYRSIELQLNHMQLYAEKFPQTIGIGELEQRNPPLLQQLVRKIRHSDENYLVQSPMIEYLLDLKGAFAITVITIFSFGWIVVEIVRRRLYDPIEKIGDSIHNLSKGKILEPINITGSKNVVAVGDELEKLRVRMGESEKQQVHFLRHISHEIKTPLTSIKEAAQLLGDEISGSINEEQREIIEILNKSSTELQSSIENLLNYNSAITVNKIRQREVVNLTELVMDVLEKHALTIKSKGLKIESSLPNQRAFVDRAQILTVYDNLLSNAIKYSPMGGSIWLLMEKRDNSVLFTIKDQGPGIKKEDQQAVFEAFFLGEHAPDGPLKGTGLGLSIARQYVEAHQGDIKLVNTPKGALFEVWLPA